MSNDEAAARLFHETYERLAPTFGYATRTDTREFDPTTPNGRLMIAACREVLAAEREAIAKLVESIEPQGDWHHNDDGSWWESDAAETLIEVARRIRARGQS